MAQPLSSCSSVTRTYTVYHQANQVKQYLGCVSPRQVIGWLGLLPVALFREKWGCPEAEERDVNNVVTREG